MTETPEGMSEAAIVARAQAAHRHIVSESAWLTDAEMREIITAALRVSETCPSAPCAPPEPSNSGRRAPQSAEQ